MEQSVIVIKQLIEHSFFHRFSHWNGLSLSLSLSLSKTHTRMHTHTHVRFEAGMEKRIWNILTDSFLSFWIYLSQADECAAPQIFKSSSCLSCSCAMWQNLQHLRHSLQQTWSGHVFQSGSSINVKHIHQSACHKHTPIVSHLQT